MLAQALASAGVPWEVAVEASGWELMLRFVELGAGVAVVNGCCRVPKGLIARPMPDLPKRVYTLIKRPGGAADSAAALLERALLAARDAWKRDTSVASVAARSPRSPRSRPQMPSDAHLNPLPASRRNTARGQRVPAR